MAPSIVVVVVVVAIVVVVVVVVVDKPESVPYLLCISAVSAVYC
jgi:hypothetical protein